MEAPISKYTPLQGGKAVRLAARLLDTLPQKRAVPVIVCQSTVQSLRALHIDKYVLQGIG